MEPLKPSEVFEVLNLELPGLEKVKECITKGDTAGANKELLLYFRDHDRMNPPSPPLFGIDYDTPASAEDVEIADNAIKHIFQMGARNGVKGWPPYDYGPDINWDADPVHNIEWPSDMHRMERWDGAVARAYKTTGDEKYAKCWVSLTRDWIRKYPVNKKHFGLARAWSTLQVGVRSPRWCHFFRCFLNSPHFTDGFLVEFLSSLHDNAKKSMLFGYTGQDNSTLYEAYGLVSIAGTFPEFHEARTWLEHGYKVTENALRTQVGKDGFQREYSPNYQLGCTRLLGNIMNISRNNNLQPSAWFIKGVSNMYEAVFAMSPPDFTLPMFGDARRFSSGKSVKDLLAEGARLFEQKKFVNIFDQKKPGLPGSVSSGLCHSGFFFFRTGWHRDDIYLALKCSPSPVEPFHSQCDSGTFELYAFGRWVMPDSGCYSYKSGSPERNWFRRTRVHNTLTLDRKDSAYAPRLRLWKTSKDLDVLTMDNASYNDFVHRKTVFFVDSKFFVFVDEALGKADDKRRPYLHFQLAPGPGVVDIENKFAHTASEKEANVLVWTDPKAEVVMEKEEGWVSVRWHEKERRPALAYSPIKENLPSVFVTFVVPFKGRNLPGDLSYRLSPDFGAGDSKIEIEVRAVGSTKTIGRDLTDETAWCR